MKTDKKSVDRLLANIRFYYIIVYMAIISIVTVIPVRLVLEGNPINSLLYPALAIFGALFLLVDLLYHKTLFKPKNCGLLVLFIVSLVISIFANMKYGLMDNLKVLLWTCIQLFLFSAIDTDQAPEMHFKHLQIVTEIFDTIWLCWATWSIMLFLQQFHRTLQFGDIINVTEMGFYQGRLFGIFIDPNYASLASIAAVVFSVLNLNIRKCCALSRVYHYIQIVVQVCYIILSGSRTARLAIAIAGALLGALLIWCFLEKRKKGIFIRIVSVVLGAGIAVGGVLQVCEFGQTVLSYAPAVYERAMADLGIPVPDYSLEDDKFDHLIQGNNAEHTHVDMERPDVSESDDISNNRFKIWKDYLQVFTTAPIFGISPRNAMQYTMEHFVDLFIIERQYSVHNTYLALLVCTGTIGAAMIYLWMVLKAWTVLSYLIRRRNTQDQYYRPVLIMTLILIVDAIAALPLYFMFYNNTIIDLIFWVTLGYVTGFIRMSEPERYGTTWPSRFTEKVFSKLRFSR